MTTPKPAAVKGYGSQTDKGELIPFAVSRNDWNLCMNPVPVRIVRESDWLAMKRRVRELEKQLEEANAKRKK